MKDQYKLIEEYRLTLEHFVRADDGRKIRVEEPIVVIHSLCSADGTPVPFVVNNMLIQMRDYMIREVQRRED